jgi:hypothetical protein
VGRVAICLGLIIAYVFERGNVLKERASCSQGGSTSSTRDIEKKIEEIIDGLCDNGHLGLANVVGSYELMHEWLKGVGALLYIRLKTRQQMIELSFHVAWHAEK